MFGKINKIIVFFILATVLSTSTLAQENTNVAKDTDFDGITDAAETNIYNTDPTKPDTDGDGALDYIEIQNNTNPNDPNSNQVVETRESANPLGKHAPIMWYVGRISGIASFIMFTMVILLGLSMTSKVWLKFRVVLTSDVLSSHTFTATFIAFCLLLLHIVSFFYDEFILLTVREALIPFTLERNLTSSLGFDLKIPVALGIISLYLAILLLVTSHLRNKLVSNKAWRMIHYSSFLFYVLFLVHAITAGTDSQEGWMIAIYVLSAGSVTFMILLRIFGKKYFMPSKKVAPAKLQQTQTPNTNMQPIA